MTYRLQGNKAAPNLISGVVYEPTPQEQKDYQTLRRTSKRYDKSNPKSMLLSIEEARRIQ
jgi:hypothetical protein